MTTHNLTIRPVNPETDFPALVELLNKVWLEPTSVERLQEWQNAKIEGEIRRRTIALNSHNQMVGYSLVYRRLSDQSGRFSIDVVVDPAHRRQGIGTTMYNEAFRFAQNEGATLLDCELYDNCPACLRFAETRGFTIDRHMFESTIDLKQFDYSPFADLIASLEATGLRFSSLAEEGNTPEAQRKLYEVNRDCSLDDPASTGTFSSFAEFQADVFQASWFRPAGQILALDGDRYVGLSAVGYFETTHSMYNLMTGVLAPYRGRKIAQALKALSLQFAQAYGSDYIRTHNDSQNGPMLAINRKLGYVPGVGEYRLTNPLSNV